MLGLLSAIAVTAGLSAAPPGAPTAHGAGHAAQSAGPPLTPPSAATDGARAADAYLARSNFLGLVGTASGSPAAVGSRPSPAGAAAASGNDAPLTGTPEPTAPPAPTTTQSNAAANAAASGPGGPGVAGPASGGTGDCNISVTDLMSALSVTCTTGDSGSVIGIGSGGDSGAVTVIPSGTGGGQGSGAAAPSTAPAGAVGASTSVATPGTQGSCVLTTSNSAAALSVSCTPGTVGSVDASASGGSPGGATSSAGTGASPAGPAGTGAAAAGASGSANGDPGSKGGDPDLAASGDGGSATTRVTTGRTGNCIIHLVNIRAALTVVCITGSSGGATGDSFGGRSGSATLLAAGSGGGATPGGAGSGGMAGSGSGGNAMAVIASGATGSCAIFLVNVMATVSVICITGNSGPAAGTATGGASGSAMLLLASAPATGGAGTGGPPRAIPGGGGSSSTMVTSGGTGTCAMSLTNTWGSISLLCRTGNSGSSLGRSIGGDSGSTLVMLTAPGPLATAGAATTISAASSFHPGSANLPSHHDSVSRLAHSPSTAGSGVVRAVRASLPSALAARRAAVGRAAATAALSAVDSPAQSAVATASFLPLTGLGTTVPMSLAAGLMLSGGLGVAATSRRRRRPGQA